MEDVKEPEIVVPSTSPDTYTALGNLIGRTVANVSKHTKTDFKTGSQTYYVIHFDNGEFLTINGLNEVN